MTMPIMQTIGGAAALMKISVFYTVKRFKTSSTYKNTLNAPEIDSRGIFRALFEVFLKGIVSLRELAFL